MHPATTPDYICYYDQPPTDRQTPDLPSLLHEDDANNRYSYTIEPIDRDLQETIGYSQHSYLSLSSRSEPVLDSWSHIPNDLPSSQFSSPTLTTCSSAHDETLYTPPSTTQMQARHLSFEFDCMDFEQMHHLDRLSGQPSSSIQDEHVCSLFRCMRRPQWHTNTLTLDPRNIHQGDDELDWYKNASSPPALASYGNDDEQEDDANERIWDGERQATTRSAMESSFSDSASIVAKSHTEQRPIYNGHPYGYEHLSVFHRPGPVANDYATIPTHELLHSAFLTRWKDERGLEHLRHPDVKLQRQEYKVGRRFVETNAPSRARAKTMVKPEMKEPEAEAENIRQGNGKRGDIGTGCGSEGAADEGDDEGSLFNGITGRIKNACISCHLRKMKCYGERPACSTCIKKGVKCEYRPHPRRRGPGKLNKERGNSILTQRSSMSMRSESICSEAKGPVSKRQRRA